MLDLYFNHAQKLVHISSSLDMFPVHFLMICEDIYMFFICFTFHQRNLLETLWAMAFQRWLRCSIRDAFISITYLIYHSFIHTFIRKHFHVMKMTSHEMATNILAFSLVQFSVSVVTNHSRVDMRMTKIIMKMQKLLSYKASVDVNKIFIPWIFHTIFPFLFFT